jgi:glutamate racemase
VINRVLRPQLTLIDSATETAREVAEVLEAQMEKPVRERTVQ